MAREEEEVVLLSLWSSPFALRAKIALTEKGVRHEVREEDLTNKSHLLLTMNPVHKKVPVLIHNGKPVCESSLIVQYIDEVWNHESPLLPSDPYERAQARFWVDFVDKKVFTAARTVWFIKGGHEDGARGELIEVLKLLETELGDKAYFGGERLGYLDVSFFPYYLSIHQLENTVESRLGGEMEAKLPKLEGWMKRCMLRESVSSVLPDLNKLSDYIRTTRKKRLDEQA